VIDAAILARFAPGVPAGLKRKIAHYSDSERSHASARQVEAGGIRVASLMLNLMATNQF
jgi:hypothetical protein